MPEFPMPGEREELQAIVVAGETVSLQAGSDRYANESLAALDGLLKNASSGDEALKLVQAREGIIRQAFIPETLTQERRIIAVREGFKMVLTTAAFATGVWLVVHGFQYSGMFIIGASLYPLAPELVTRFLGRKEES